MRSPVMRGTIDRRILVNFSIDPVVLDTVLPAPFRPKLVNGRAVGGICLIRLTQVRPSGLPAIIGVRSENAAHRIAVVWDEDGTQREGVFIPRRDTSSRLNIIVGGRFFPGVHHQATFTVDESVSRLRVGFQSDDGHAHALLSGHVAGRLPTWSIFGSVDEVSEFFAAGSVGYSATANPRRFDGLELKTRTWAVRPLEVDELRSSFFDDEQIFPPGSRRFDNALVMTGIEHEWHPLPTLRAGSDGNGRRTSGIVALG